MSDEYIYEYENSSPSYVSKRIKRKIVVGCLIPSILLFLPVLFVVGIAGGMATSASESLVEEYKISAEQITASWQSILAFDTVRFENEFEDVVPGESAMYFMVVDYERYKKETEEDPETGEVISSSWVLVESGTLDSPQEIRDYFGLSNGATVGDVVDAMSGYEQPRPYTFVIYSKTIETVSEEANFTDEQKEWLGALITEGVLSAMFGGDFPSFIGDDGNGFFAWPLPGIPESNATSSYGKREDPFTGKEDFHYGTDIGCQTGTPVIAVADGVIKSCGENGGTAGTFVTIQHEIDGYIWVTKYFHLSQINCSVGDEVKRGTVIALSGNTGRSTGPHLHIETICNGVYQNPLQLITQKEGGE